MGTAHMLYQARPLALRPLVLSFSCKVASRVTTGGCRIVMFRVNMLRSGRCSSLGGGGLGGRLADRVGTGMSGSSISSFNE
jgi:hypothetical protein